jgi:hypothetical protein
MTVEECWAEYARTIVEIAFPAGAPLCIRPAPAGEVGRWPSVLPSTSPVHFLTAWDPGGARPGAGENRRQQAALAADIAALGGAVWRTVGHDPDSDHREVGVAVAGLREAEARDLGRRYGQDAIFSWTPQLWSIVSCVDGARLDIGWRLEGAEG